MHNSGRYRQPFVASLACILLAVEAITAQAGPTQTYNQGDPTVYEQFLLEMVNRARLNPTGEASMYGIDLNEGLTAGTLSTDPRPPVAFNPSLIASARGHSQWMLDQDVFSHTGTNGSTPMDRMEAAGYVFTPPWTYGENIAWYGTTGTLDMPNAVEQNHRNLFVDSGIEGRGHRINLLNAAFVEIGLGVIEGLFTSNDNIARDSAMVTQDFGATAANPSSFLVGVVYHDLDGNGFYSPGEGLGGVTVTPSEGNYYAITSASGGYAIPLNAVSGTMTVTISQGALTVPITKTVQLTGLNVKLDFETIKDTPAGNALTLGLPQIASDGRLILRVSGTAGQTVGLQTSTDLKLWQSSQTVTLSGTETNLFDTPPTAPARRFYRLIGM